MSFLLLGLYLLLVYVVYTAVEYMMFKSYLCLVWIMDGIYLFSVVEFLVIYKFMFFVFSLYSSIWVGGIVFVGFLLILFLVVSGCMKCSIFMMVRLN